MKAKMMTWWRDFAFALDEVDLLRAVVLVPHVTFLIDKGNSDRQRFLKENTSQNLCLFCCCRCCQDATATVLRPKQERRQTLCWSWSGPSGRRRRRWRTYEKYNETTKTRMDWKHFATEEGRLESASLQEDVPQRNKRKIGKDQHTANDGDENGRTVTLLGSLIFGNVDISRRRWWQRSRFASWLRTQEASGSYHFRQIDLDETTGGCLPMTNLGASWTLTCIVTALAHENEKISHAFYVIRFRHEIQFYLTFFLIPVGPHGILK